MKEKNKIDFKQIEDLMQDFSQSTVSSMTIKKDKYEVIAKKRRKVIFVEDNNKEDDIIKQNENIEYKELTFIESDRVGRFFSANPPDSPLRLKNGDFISKGSKIANIVSMNVVYDVIAPFDLIVTQCLGEDGKMVEYGQAIFEVEPCGGN
jgi:biotin carboxyl carrier protein